MEQSLQDLLEKEYVECWVGVVDFLRESPNWRLLERGQMGNGMTVLERVTDN